MKLVIGDRKRDMGGGEGRWAGLKVSWDFPSQPGSAELQMHQVPGGGIIRP